MARAAAIMWTRTATGFVTTVVLAAGIMLLGTMAAVTTAVAGKNLL